jgi:hypothetical protein
MPMREPIARIVIATSSRSTAWSCRSMIRQALVVLDGIEDAGQAGVASETISGSWTMTTPTDCLNPARILSALERQSSAWIRVGPRSIEHTGLRVRLTLGIVTVRIAHIVPDGVPVPIQAAPATRDRIAKLLEDRLCSAISVDLDPDDLARGASSSP